MEETRLRLRENVAGLLCYLLGWITGAIFLIIEPKNRFVRFQAFQSVIVFGILTALLAAVGWSSVGFLIWPVFGLFIAFWFWLMLAAVCDFKYRLPIVGGLVERWLG